MDAKQITKFEKALKLFIKSYKLTEDGCQVGTMYNDFVDCRKCPFNDYICISRDKRDFHKAKKLLHLMSIINE